MDVTDLKETQAVAVAIKQMADEMNSAASLDQRRALLGRRRRVIGLRGLSSMLATGVLAVWVAALVALTVFNG